MHLLVLLELQEMSIVRSIGDSRTKPEKSVTEILLKSIAGDPDFRLDFHQNAKLQFWGILDLFHYLSLDQKFQSG